MKNRGFTLIELMIVAAIIAILAMIALPKFSNLIDRAREASTKGNLGALRSALSIYQADNEGQSPFYRTPYTGVYHGIYHLHGKYIDFERLTFAPPRYAGTGLPSMNALQLFSPTMANIMLRNTYRQGAPMPVPIHTGEPYPSYFVWVAANGNTNPDYVSIRMYPYDPVTFQPLRDLSGELWSHW
jgi:prepilin-type N-terminal cleavage/methylation domain-containing protein